MSQPGDTVRAAIRTLKDLGDTVHATVNDAVSSADRDQIADRLRDLPFQAVRLAVAGVGQAIALADRVQNLIEEQGRGDKDSEKNRETEPARRPEGHTRETGRNGSVVAMPRPGGADDAARAQRAAARRAERPARSVPTRPAAKPTASKPATSKPAASKPAASKPAASKPATPKASAPKTTAPKTAAPKAAAQKPAKKAEAKGAAPADLPVQGYETASLASVRARLRNLTQADLRKLCSYEKAHAARPEFLTMFDNRLAKLRGSTDA